MKASTLSEQGRGLKRILSGFFLAPLVAVIVLYAPPFWLAVTVAIIIALALNEYVSLTATRGRFWVLPAGMLTPFLFLHEGYEHLLVFTMVVVVFTASVVSILGGRDFSPAFTDTAKAVFGIIYVGFTLSHVVLFPPLQDGRLLLLTGLLVIWANDIFAYLTGRLVGRHSLSPRISPRKTIEGAIGGVAGGVVVGLGVDGLLDTGLSTAEMAGSAVAMGVFGLVGDLFESVIKRSAGVKDSGTIIPGHGGMLDRIDSMLFSLPVFYHYLTWKL